MNRKVYARRHYRKHRERILEKNRQWRNRNKERIKELYRREAARLTIDNGQSREIITRRDALQAGMTHYFTGTPCHDGHIAPRHVLNRRCIICRRLSGKRHRVNRSESQIARDREREHARWLTRDRKNKYLVDKLYRQQHKTKRNAAETIRQRRNADALRALKELGVIGTSDPDVRRRNREYYLAHREDFLLRAALGRRMRPKDKARAREKARIRNRMGTIAVHALRELGIEV